MWNEAGYILSLVAIGNYLPFALYINAETGTFSSHEEPVRIIFELCTELDKLVQTIPSDSSPEFQPVVALLPFPTLITHAGEMSEHPTRSSLFSRKFNELGSVSGVLNCIRVHKVNDHAGEEEPSGNNNMLIALTTVFASVLGALVSTTTISPAYRLSALISIIGCSLIWLTNWVLSILLSRQQQKKTFSITTYAYLLLACDILSMMSMCGCFFWSFVTWRGIKESTETVNPWTPAMWIVIMAIEWVASKFLKEWVGSKGSGSRQVWFRSVEETLADSDAVV